MAKRRKRISAEQAAFDERTKTINDHVERLRRRVEERKAAEQKSAS